MIPVDELFQGRTRVDGRDVGFILGMPGYGYLAPFLEGRSFGDEKEWIAHWIFSEVAQFDGQRLNLAKAATLLDHPHVLVDILGARNRLHDEARQKGRMFAVCPGCKTTEAELSFMDLLLRLGMAPPPLTMPDAIWLAPPAIGTPVKLVRGIRRGDLPMAHTIRFELPSARMGIGAPKRPTGGVMAVLDEATEEAAWERFWPEGSRTPDERVWWDPENLPFRALVRLAAATARFVRGPKPSPASLEVLPAFDVEYLDMAVMAAQFTDEPTEEKPAPGLVPRPRNLPVTCASCATQYLPLL